MVKRPRLLFCQIKGVSTGRMQSGLDDVGSLIDRKHRSRHKLQRGRQGLDALTLRRIVKRGLRTEEGQRKGGDAK